MSKQLVDQIMRARTREQVEQAQKDYFAHLRKHPNDKRVILAGSQLAKMARLHGIS